MLALGDEVTVCPLEYAVDENGGTIPTSNILLTYFHEHDDIFAGALLVFPEGDNVQIRVFDYSSGVVEEPMLELFKQGFGFDETRLIISRADTTFDAENLV